MRKTSDWSPDGPAAPDAGPTPRPVLAAAPCAGVVYLHTENGPTFRFLGEMSRDVVEEDETPLEPARAASQAEQPAARAEEPSVDPADARRAQEERRAAALLEGVADAFFAIGPDGRLTYVNGAAERLLGIARDDVLGKDIREVAAPVLGTDFEANCRKAVAEQSPVSFGAYSPRERWYEARAYPSCDGLAVHFRDVTDRAQAEALAREWEARYGAAVKATGRALCEWDAAAGGLAWGGNCEGALGYRADEMPGDIEGFMELVHPDDRPEVEAGVGRTRASGEPLRLECRLLHKGGAYVAVSAEGHSFRGADDRLQVVALLADVTERRRLERQLRQAQRTADEVSTDLEAAMEQLRVVSARLRRRVRTEEERAGDTSAANSPILDFARGNP